MLEYERFTETIRILKELDLPYIAAIDYSRNLQSIKFKLMILRLLLLVLVIFLLLLFRLLFLTAAGGPGVAGAVGGLGDLDFSIFSHFTPKLSIFIG